MEARPEAPPAATNIEIACKTEPNEIFDFCDTFYSSTMAMESPAPSALPPPPSCEDWNVSPAPAITVTPIESTCLFRLSKQEQPYQIPDSKRSIPSTAAVAIEHNRMKRMLKLELEALRGALIGGVQTVQIKDEKRVIKSETVIKSEIVKDEMLPLPQDWDDDVALWDVCKVEAADQVPVQSDTREVFVQALQVGDFVGVYCNDEVRYWVAQCLGKDKYSSEVSYTCTHGNTEWGTTKGDKVLKIRWMERSKIPGQPLVFREDSTQQILLSSVLPKNVVWQERAANGDLLMDPACDVELQGLSRAAQAEQASLTAWLDEQQQLQSAFV